MSRRPRPPDDVFFPVVPMLDMAFQLLAFFILTFQAPTRETWIDLDLPIAPAALPGAGAGAESRTPVPAKRDQDLETTLLIRAEADDAGALRSLKLGELPLSGTDALEDRLRRYVDLLAGEPLRVALAADDRLHYEEAARLIGACSTAGVTTLRLTEPPRTSDRARPGARP